MMGRQATGREQLFYTFSMEDQVPEDHLLRGIHQFLDLSSFRQHLEPFYSPVGRPSIDPELMDPHADRGLLLRHSFRAATVRGSPSQPGLTAGSAGWAWKTRYRISSTFSKNRHGRFRDKRCLPPFV